MSPADWETVDTNDKDEDLRSISQYCSNSDHIFWCLMDENNEIIGTIAMRLIDSGFEYSMKIKRLYIKPSEQGKGLGNFLLDYACNY